MRKYEVHYSIKLGLVMITVEENSQVCVDEQFQSEVAPKTPARERGRGKPARDFACWDQDHHDQPIVGNT